MRVERYFHIRPPQPQLLPNGDKKWGVAPKGGATVLVVGDTDEDTVMVRVTLCSRKDAYCRRTGRETAVKHPMQRIDLSALPNFLLATSFDVVRKVCRTPRSQRLDHPLCNVDYSFATRYFKARAPVAA